MFSISAQVHAQTETDTDESDAPPSPYHKVTANGVGVMGGIIAGAEVVLVTESIIRVKPLWPYIVIPIAGAVGGGIGGYKLEQKTRGGAIALLITSMVGVIPTLIATSSARSFHPEDVGAHKGSESLQTIDYNQFPEQSMPSENGESVEVEARPDGIPEDAMGPPPPPPDASQPADAGPGATEKQPEYELNVEPAGEEPADAAPESRLPAETDERLAHLSSGALLHMNRQLRFGLGIPAIDVAPVQSPQPWSSRHGVAVHIPLIALDLP
ncbi:MAG: hypothetical protein JXX14_09735 [Deltaproteobacteria bacterium]|nr:hypothetical protein [Deltaproteobacteria bacterium]